MLELWSLSLNFSFPLNAHWFGDSHFSKRENQKKGVRPSHPPSPWMVQKMSRLHHTRFRRWIGREWPERSSYELQNLRLGAQIARKSSKWAFPHSIPISGWRILNSYIDHMQHSHCPGLNLKAEMKLEIISWSSLSFHWSIYGIMFAST